MVNGIPTPPSVSTQRLAALRDSLSEGLIERDVAVRLALLAALAGEHLLLLGPPGTAKSLIARRLKLAFRGATYFERLLTRFTVPEELFGPLSIKALEEDRYERLIDRYLPSATVAFLDEIFKANSAILNALLTLLNEREFDNGTERVITPLAAVVGASNELPVVDELSALFDRFLLRLHVLPVSSSGFQSLLDLRGASTPAVPDSIRLSRDEILEVQRAAEGVKLSEDVRGLLVALRQWCQVEKVSVSDRRWRKIVKLLQVSAVTHGRDQVSIWDCWLLRFAVGDTHSDAERVFEWYRARVGAIQMHDTGRLTTILVAWEAKLKEDREGRSQAMDANGRLVYAGKDGKPHPSNTQVVQKTRGGKALYLGPVLGGMRHFDRTNGGNGWTQDELQSQWGVWHNLSVPSYVADVNNWLTETVSLAPLMEPTRHKLVYVQQCIRQVLELVVELGIHRDGIEQRLAALDSDLRSHLWVTPDLIKPASRALRRSLDETNALAKRTGLLLRGFATLPVEPQLRPTDENIIVSALKSLAEKYTKQHGVEKFLGWTRWLSEQTQNQT